MSVCLIVTVWIVLYCSINLACFLLIVGINWFCYNFWEKLRFTKLIPEIPNFDIALLTACEESILWCMFSLLYFYTLLLNFMLSGSVNHWTRSDASTNSSHFDGHVPSLVSCFCFVCHVHYFIHHVKMSNFNFQVFSVDFIAVQMMSLFL